AGPPGADWARSRPRLQQRVHTVGVELPAHAVAGCNEAGQALRRPHDRVALDLHADRPLVTVPVTLAPLETQDDVTGLRGEPVGAAVANQVADAAARAHASRLRLVGLVRGHPAVGAGRVENRLGGLVCAVDSVVRAHGIQ